jgi:hypothetical protein
VLRKSPGGVFLRWFSGESLFRFVLLRGIEPVTSSCAVLLLSFRIRSFSVIEGENTAF